MKKRGVVGRRVLFNGRQWILFNVGIGGLCTLRRPHPRLKRVSYNACAFVHELKFVRGNYTIDAKKY